MKTGLYTKILLPHIGEIWIAKTKRGVCRLELGGGKTNFISKLPFDTMWREDKTRFKAMLSKLKNYVSGKQINLGMGQIDFLTGTPFQRRVWKKITTIPRGETRSYAWLACTAGRPRAIRAAANACGANPVPIIIPCHRVIASNGKIGGFSSGLRFKKKLLKLEGVQHLE